MKRQLGAVDPPGSEEITRLREENQQLQNLITNISINERKFYTLFELSHDAIVLLDETVVADLNQTLEKVFGYSRQELLQQTADMLVPQGAYEEFIRHMYAAINRDPQFFEYRLVKKGGELLECEVSAAALTLHHRQFFMVDIRDITQRKATEENLRVKTAQLQATINSLPFDFWINDTRNRTILQNPRSKELWGEQFGQHMEAVTSDEGIKTNWRDSNQRALEGEVVEREQAYTIAGRTRIYRNIVAPVWGDHAVIGILGLNIDITDYKATQQKLFTALEERETLLREIHHRVKNNLQLIISMLNLQKPGVATDQLDAVRNIENRINSMALIHDQLYDSTSLNRINMPDYLEQLSNSICESYDLAQRTISIDVSVAEIDLQIDIALPLGIIVNELVSNSLKHAFRNITHGEIKIQLLEQADSNLYRLVVRDNGRGCEKERPASAAGLGLTLVQQLAIQLDGAVSVDTRNGFSTTIQFPIGAK
jgi:PAS domain S-box-containing protein